MSHAASENLGLKRVVRIVAWVNFAYFAIELGVAWRIGSVSLLSDSADFLEDAAVAWLILAAFAWSPRARSRLGMVLSGTLVLPVLIALATAAHKFVHPTVPSPLYLCATGLGALVVNGACALLLKRHRSSCGSLTTAAFLSERNDAIADVFIVVAGLLTAWAWRSAWPDVLAGLGIVAMNAKAARTVWRTARGEASGSGTGQAGHENVQQNDQQRNGENRQDQDDRRHGPNSTTTG